MSVCIYLCSKLEYEVIIVEDNSPDGTRAVAHELKRIYPGKIKIHENEKKNGLGAAYINGIELVAKESEFIFIMDADMSHHVSAGGSIPT